MAAADPTGQRELDAWLGRLADALDVLPARERDDILLETRSHVLESLHRAGAPTVAEVLEELGEPREYARGFLAERPPAAAKPIGVLEGLARVARRRGLRIPVLALAGVAYAVVAMLLVTALSELVDPTNTGLYADWSSTPRHLGIVLSDPRHPAGEVLGGWLIPVALLLIALIHLGMRALLRRLVGRDEGPTTA